MSKRMQAFYGAIALIILGMVWGGQDGEVAMGIGGVIIFGLGLGL